MINIYDDSSEDFLEELCAINHQSGNPIFPCHPKLTSPEVKDDVFDPNYVLKPLFPYPIPVKDSDSFLKKSDTSLSYLDISLLEFETFVYHTKETNSGSTTTHADYSLPKYDSFLFEIKPDQGKLTSVVMKDNLAEPRVHVPNVLTTHPTLKLDSDFIHPDNSLPEFETFYFDFEEKNSGSTTIYADISLSILECFNFDDKPDPSEVTNIVDSEIRENVLFATNVNLPPEEDHSPLFAYVDFPFELMCGASNFAIGAVLGQRQEKHFRPIHYASKTTTEAESNYTTMEKLMLAVVYAFEKFRSYLIMNKIIVYTDHSALKYHFAKKDSKAILSVGFYSFKSSHSE
nr:reverse transcriptase domain-containing protein [Tanacetum cinerariifolium]